MQQRTTIYASDGKTVIATLFDQNRQVVPLSQVPKSVIKPSSPPRTDASTHTTASTCAAWCAVR